MVGVNGHGAGDVSVETTGAGFVGGADHLRRGRGQRTCGRPGTQVKTLWPAKVGAFAKSFSGPVWYPKTIPSGYKTDSIDIVELEPGSGLICDIIFVNGEKSLGFTQGSPKTRDYEIVSIGEGAVGNRDRRPRPTRTPPTRRRAR